MMWRCLLNGPDHAALAHVAAGLAVLLPAALASANPPPRAGPVAVLATTLPYCATASHERLLVRAGRDICAPTLSRSGRPTAAGFMPTGCRAATQTYQIDAAGLSDRCHPPLKTEK